MTSSKKYVFRECEDRNIIDKDPLKIWCPKPGCQYWTELDFITYKKLKLVCKCGFEFCGHCTEEWHPDIKCDKARGEF